MWTNWVAGVDGCSRMFQRSGATRGMVVVLTDGYPEGPAGGPGEQLAAISPTAQGLWDKGIAIQPVLYGAGADQQRPAIRQSADGLDTDQDLTTVLYRKYYMPLVRQAVLRGADRGTAEDAVQNAFVIMLGRWDQLRDTNKALPYLSTVVRRLAARSQRRGARETPVPNEWLVAAGGVQADASAESAAKEFLQLLPPRQRTVLEFTADGYRPSEIAEILGMREGAVRVNLHEARKKARPLAAAGFRADAWPDLPESRPRSDSAPQTGG